MQQLLCLRLFVLDEVVGGRPHLWVTLGHIPGVYTVPMNHPCAAAVSQPNISVLYPLDTPMGWMVTFPPLIGNIHPQLDAVFHN